MVSCVDFPEPSGPSKTRNLPRSAVWSAAGSSSGSSVDGGIVRVQLWGVWVLTVVSVACFGLW